MGQEFLRLHDGVNVVAMTLITFGLLPSLLFVELVEVAFHHFFRRNSMCPLDIVLPDLLQFVSLTVAKDFSRVAFLPVEVRDCLGQLIRCQQQRSFLRMNYICEVHTDIVYLTTLATPVFIRIRSTNNSSSHDNAISALTSANHIELVANMGFLIIPDAPVVVETFIEEVLHSILKLRQCVVADVRIPAHDECLAEVFTNDPPCPIEQLVPLLNVHLVKQGLCFIKELEFILFLHQVAEILEFHHLAGITLHHAYILTSTNKHILLIIYDTYAA